MFSTGVAASIRSVIYSRVARSACTGQRSAAEPPPPRSSGWVPAELQLLGRSTSGWGGVARPPSAGLRSIQQPERERAPPPARSHDQRSSATRAFAWSRSPSTIRAIQRSPTCSTPCRLQTTSVWPRVGERFFIDHGTTVVTGGARMFTRQAPPIHPATPVACRRRRRARRQ